MGLIEEMEEAASENDIMGVGAVGGTAEVPIVINDHHPNSQENATHPMELTPQGSGSAVLATSSMMLTMTQLLAKMGVGQAEKRALHVEQADMREKLDTGWAETKARGKDIYKGNGQQYGCHE